MPGEDLDRMWSMDISKEAKDTLVENMYLGIVIISTKERFRVCRVHESLIYSQGQQRSILFLTA